MSSHVLLPPEPGRVVVNIDGQYVEARALADALASAGESLRALLTVPEHAEHEARSPEWETTTPRGFGFTKILVSNYEGMEPVEFTVQESSLATERKVWIGFGDDRAHMNVDEATRVRDALSAFLADAEQGDGDA